jgi:hypothetical protein
VTHAPVRFVVFVHVPSSHCAVTPFGDMSLAVSFTLLAPAFLTFFFAPLCCATSGFTAGGAAHVRAPAMTPAMSDR